MTGTKEPTEELAAHMTPDIDLTPRELEVLQLMSAGESNKLIANTLGVSTHTVKFHVGNVCKKLGVTTRAGASVRGVRLGLVPLVEPTGVE